MTRPTTTTMIAALLLALLPAGTSLIGSTPEPTETTAITAATGAPDHWLTALVTEHADADTIDLAVLMTRAQANEIGETLIPRPHDAPPAPSQSVLRLLELRGLDVQLDTLVDLAVLDQAPEPMRGALAALLADFVWYHQATTDAISGIDATSIDLRNPPADIHVPLGGIMSAQIALLEDAGALSQVLKTTDARLAQNVFIPGALSFALDGVCTDDTHTQELPLMLEECGNDVYENNAGGGHTAVCPSSQDPTDAMPAAAFFDFAGDDSYQSGRNCGINGGGALGAGLLYDELGNDAYVTEQITWSDGNDGINGGGVLGSGMIVDAAGNDVYIAGGWGTNGGGYIGGRGFLLDDGVGDDWYAGTQDAVNGGGAAGIGMLSDMGGTDWYAQSWPQVGDYDITIVPKEAAGAQLDW